MSGFSIIVCCYNSARILPVTFSYLSKLIIPENWTVEVIVVDNCCTDGTEVVVRELWRQYNSPFKLCIVEERTPGLSAARVKGIETACFDYLIFCDDDNFLDSDYLVAASKVLLKNEKIGALGGYATPIQENRPDYWPSDFYLYGSGPQADKSGETMTLHGAGIIVRKKAFERLKEAKFQFILSDRKGNQLSSGGDYELCFAITLAGFEVWYDDSIRFSHFINEQRFTKEYCKRFIKESAPAVDVIELYKFFIYDDRNDIRHYYLKNLKDLLFHIKKIFLSYFFLIRYRYNEKVQFMEFFHIRFHFARIRLILKNVPKYPSMLQKIRLLRERLLELEQ